MGMFDFLKVCLFSEVNGVVTLGGRPVAGAEVIRTAVLNNKVYRDTTTTDAGGHYHLEARFTRSVNSILPVEPFIYQKMFIRYQGKEHRAWEVDKRNYDVNGEIKKPLNLSCELTDPEEKKWFGPRVVLGKCKIN